MANGKNESEIKYRPLNFSKITLENCLCEKRGGTRKRCQEEALEMCKRATSGYNYTFENFVYTGMRNKVTITCHEIDKITGKEHGDFEVYLKHLLNGSRCPKCKGKVFGVDDFIAHAEHVHGKGKYDYSLIKEFNGNTNDFCTIICHEKDEIGREHGEFKQRFGVHLRGSGCPNCSKKYGLGKEVFVKRAKDVHGDKYTYDNFEYKSVDTKSWITCPIHGDFKQTPSSHLKGCGCPYCNNSKMESSLGVSFDSNSIYYETQVRHKKLGRQTIDFYLPQNHLYIECQGQHHYMPVKFDKSSSDEEAEKSYNKRVKLDKEKYDVLTSEGNIVVYYVSLSQMGMSNVDIHGGWYSDKLVFTSRIDLIKYINSLPTFDYIKKERAIRKKKEKKHRIVWDYEKCKEEASKYNTRTEFERGCEAAYNYARKNGWMDEFIPALQKPNGYWKDRDNIINAYNSCKDYTEFRTKYDQAYYWALKFGILEELGHKTQNKKNTWSNKEAVYNVAMKCNSKSEFIKRFKGAYNASIRNGYYSELMVDVFGKHTKRGYWKVKENIVMVAKECKDLIDLRKKYPGAYSSAYRNGWLDDLVYKD